jgi:hypothetical protein
MDHPHFRMIHIIPRIMEMVIYPHLHDTMLQYLEDMTIIIIITIIITSNMWIHTLGLVSTSA